MNATDCVFETSIVGRDVQTPTRTASSWARGLGILTRSRWCFNSAAALEPPGNTFGAGYVTWPSLDVSWDECPA